MENPKISIIVPVYNVEKYIHRCLDSIAAQTFTDWECICVDDGTPDASGKICDEYAQKDTRFKVIHKQNEGVSIARNTGLNAAVGEWIGFVDSDDWIEKETYETALQYAINNDADIVQWGYCRSDGKNDYAFCVYNNDYSLLNFKNTLAETEPYFGFILTLTKRELLTKNNILFPMDMIMGEDYIFSLNCYLAAKKVCNIKGKCFYHYFQNPNSACHTMSEKHIQGQILFINRFEDMVKKTNYSDSLINIVNRHKAGFKLRMLKEKQFSVYRKYFNEIEKDILKRQKVFKPAILLIKIHFDFFASIYLSVISILLKLKQKIRK